MKTIKFYTNNNKYMGWIKYKSFSENWLELRSWIDRGNSLEFKDCKVNAHEIGKLCLVLKTL